MLLDEADPKLPQFGALFAEYVASRIPEMFFSYPADYHHFFQMLESTLAPQPLRWIWLRESIGWLSSVDPAPPLFLARTVFGCLRIASTAGPDMRKAILGVYLPNLLGLTGGLKPKLVEQAIRLSHEKYCSASIMLGKTAEITEDYELIEEPARA